MNCPDCSKPMIGVEYAWGNRNHYDGVSEWDCESCHLRIGRWSKKRLESGEQELVFGGER